jgi:AmiR/NasT family two-component response regulator
MSLEVPIAVPLRQCDQQRITDAVDVIAQSRALIEQTKGMLMLVLGVDATRAFDILRSQSQQQNVKLRVVAERVSKDLLEMSRTRSQI